MTARGNRGGTAGRRVLFLEFNEITWTLIEPLMSAGKLPNFARLRGEGAWATPVSVDEPPHLDPWVTWVSVHTGVSRDVHGATVLEQDSSTIAAPRTWHYAADAGKTVGVFGSISAYPPRPVPGFIVPGPFAPGPETYPEYLAPVQRLNRTQTQIHNKLSGESPLLEMARDGISLLGFGLKPTTIAHIAGQLARERVQPHLRWKRVALQPLVNFDFFRTLYERYRPDFATWHTNHCAHYMHHYWKAHDDSAFPTPCDERERRKFGEAVEHGYRVADDLLGRFMAMADDDTVIVLASSMGQKPYLSDDYRDGRTIVSFKDIERVLDIIGRQGVAEVNPIMAPQWNLVVPDAEHRSRIRAALESAYREGVGSETREAFSVTETEQTITVNPKGLAADHDDIRVLFPGCPGASDGGYPFEELLAKNAPTRKQGMHHPDGVLVLWGRGIRPGVHIDGTDNLDIAPTVLSLLGIDVPEIMTGRVLSEAWTKTAEVRPPAKASTEAAEAAAPA